LAEASELTATAEREKPMLIIADFEPRTEVVARAVAELKRSETTSHIPVIGLVSARNAAAQESARNASVTLVVQDTVILQHLPQFLDQALALD
jgi:CheY-like chemotaxis protein